MSQVKASVDTGNFTVVVSGNLKADVVDKKLSEGVVYDLQRGGLSAAYVALGGVENDKGKKKLPDGFKREHVEYNDDNALAMQEAVEAWAKDLFEGTPEITVSRYEGSEAASPMKRATHLVDTFLGTDLEAGYRSILGLPNGSREELIAKANEQGLGMQPPKAKKNGQEAEA